MDFYNIKERNIKKGVVEIYPDFVVGRSKDLMIRGNAFYAIWDEKNNIWSKDEYDVKRLVDEELYAYYEKCKNRGSDITYILKTLGDYSSNCWNQFKKYTKQLSDNYHVLDSKVTFMNTNTSKKDYISKRVNYSMNEGTCAAYEEMISTLYAEEERQKIEWAIGAIIAGDAKSIQKFLVFYGEGGTGKSTMLNIIQKLFHGYYISFDAKELVAANNAYTSGALFNNEPLVAIQHDGDLSGIKDNSKLNSIIAHEEIIVNEKFKTPYTARANCFLFMGTNKPVKITDGKSGIIRRLIDVHPTGNKLPPARYNELFDKIDFELGAIANHCYKVYTSLGKNYYNTYKPMDMMYKTDAFFNFVQEQYYIFKENNGTTLKAAYALYKQYCEESGSEYILEKYKFREELKNYFKNFEDETRDADGKHVYSYYSGFLYKKFEKTQEKVEKTEEPVSISLVLDRTESLLDKELADCPAQYANQHDTPSKPWDKVKTKLSAIDTHELHYLKPKNPNHIVIDFDLKDENGEKSLEKNLEAASKFPPTYAEASKSGKGIHLHYIYDGDVDTLARVYDENIEIKVFTGNSSLRRKLSKCNGLPIAHISEGLPLRGDNKKMIFFENIKNEKAIRTIIIKNLKKEYHPNTKPSIDFIYDTLEKAYNSGMKYDVSDLQNDVMTFAMRSSNQSDYCIRRVGKMKFKSDEPSENKETAGVKDIPVFFDAEVFPNLFVVCWKLAGDHKVVPMINPTPTQIEELLKFKLIGFNNRKYDNHILYAAMMGYTPLQLFKLSQKIIEEKKGFFGEAYNLSYTDVYDFASAGNKKSLKKWEIELGIHHQENNYPWDQPVPEDKWNEIADYCCNDVIATEAVFNHLSGDWTARKILADISGMTVNDTTNSLSTRIIFGKNRKPQNEFNYRNLAEPVGSSQYDEYREKFGSDYQFRVFDSNGLPLYRDYIPGEELPPGYSILPFFPGYTFNCGKSVYMGEEIGEGGKVYSEPGMYNLVWDGDVTGQHPSSIIAEVLFGPKYTKAFKEIVDGRVSIKHKAWADIDELFDGKLKPYIQEVINGRLTTKALANALKTVVNSVYGLTSASFENPFRDPRNIDNIVAKRGALFMTLLKSEVQKRGFTVCHIKTDSIKIPNATSEIINFVLKFGKEYGYSFETEAIFEKFCIVNDAVYIAKLSKDDEGWIADCQKAKAEAEEKNIPYVEPTRWTATGTQFAVPYVFKTLFSHEEIKFEDMCETKSTGTALYLDMNEGHKDVSHEEQELEKLKKEFDKGKITKMQYQEGQDVLNEAIVQGHNYIFVGKVGAFTPVIAGAGGGELMRIEKDGRYSAATGTKGYRWMESEMVKSLGYEDKIDKSYYRNLVDNAVASLNEYGDVERFLAEEPYEEFTAMNKPIETCVA